MLESLRSSFKRCIAPIARLFVRYGMSANMVTVVGSLATVAISMLTAFTGWLLPGSLLLTICVLADALDGSIAAISHNNTQFGAFLDSTLDRIADGFLFMMVLICLFRAQPQQISSLLPLCASDCVRRIGLFAGLIAMLVAFVTSYARARGQSLQVDAQQGFVTRADRVAIILVATGLSGVVGQLYWLSLAMVVLAIGGTATVVERILEVKTVLE